MSCDCLNIPDMPGILRNVRKCAAHQPTPPESLGEAYYRASGAMDADASVRYVREITEAIGEVPFGTGLAVEIGCGVSPYCSYLMGKGYSYLGIDLSLFACDEMRSRGADAIQSTTLKDSSISLILAAHSLEHMKDAPGELVKMYHSLAPGGLLVLIVPDDSDRFNPDHLWFFTPDGLLGLLERTGFTIERFAVRRILPYENFIYVLARKAQ